MSGYSLCPCVINALAVSLFLLWFETAWIIINAVTLAIYSCSFAGAGHKLPPDQGKALKNDQRKITDGDGCNVRSKF